MYCPKCAREQPSNDMRFCSGCGFQLGVVSRLLTTDGVLSAAEMLPLQAPQPVRPMSPKERGVRRGGKIVFFSLLVVLPIFIFFTAISDQPEFMLIPFMSFLAGLVWMLYAAIFAEGRPVASAQSVFQQSQMHTPQLNAPPQPFAMPNQNPHHTPAPPRRIETAPNLQPPSVTESTTRLLEKERS